MIGFARVLLLTTLLIPWLTPQLGVTRGVFPLIAVGATVETPYLPQAPKARPSLPSLRVAQVPQPKPAGKETGGAVPPLAPISSQPPNNPPEGAPPALALTPEDIQIRSQRVQADAQLEEGLRRQIVELYERALQEVSAAEKARSQAEQFRQMREATGEEIKKLEAEAAQLEVAPVLPHRDSLSLEEVEKATREAEERLTAARAARDAVEAEITRRNTARQSAKQRLEAAQKRLEATREALTTPPKADQPPALLEAERVLRQAEWESARWEVEALQQELAYYDRADEALLPLQKRVAAQRYRAAENEFKQWQQLLAEKRQAEAVSRLAKAKRRREELPPALRTIAEELENSAAEVARLTARANAVSTELAHAKEQLEALQQQFKTTKERMGVVGMTAALGLWLRAQQAKLPDTHAIWQRIRQRQEDIRKVQWDVLELSDRHAQMPPLEEQIAQWKTRLRAEDLADHPEWEETLRELLAESYSLLDQQVQLHNRWLNDLVDLDNTERATVRLINEYRHFIYEHILWIPNTPVINFAALPEQMHLALGVYRMLFGMEAATSIGKVAWRDVLENAGLWISAIFLFLVWKLALIRLRGVLPTLATRASRGISYGFWPTLEATALAVAEAVWLPAVLVFVAWRLSSPLESTSVTLIIAAGLQSAAEFLLVFDGVRRVATAGGLGEAHFHWPGPLAAALRRHLRWFVVFGALTSYLCAAIHASGDQRWEAGPGRFSFLVMMILYMALAILLFRPRSPIWDAVKAHHPEGWFYRGRFLWWLGGMVTPLALAGVTLLGYSYTAIILAQRFRLTIILPVTLGILEELFSRWLVVRKQRIGWNRAKRKRQAETQTPETATESGGVVALPPESEPDLALVGSQTRRLFKTLQLILAVMILWWIWADVLPALGILRQIRLWGGSLPVPTASTAPLAPGGETTPAAVPLPSRAITLADLLLAIITLVIGFVVARNIAGLMEMLLPQRLPMDPGLRYALHTVASYVVIGVAMILAVGRLGLQWSQAQWLVAALGVGLGFGLQEVFANFVSGLIILFERPVRVGDLVTVGEFSGIVTRIRIRATTILNFERRELIIPNKEFITGKVINWTLSDRTNRIEVAVGVAYGTDPDKVISLMLEVAKSNPYVLSDPAPVVLFEGFGDSSLNFRLYAYLPSYDNRLAAINSLHAEVYRRLQAEGISIPFPQRDVHLYYETPHSDPPAAKGPAPEHSGGPQ